jgi:hypothetical protein
MGEEVRRPGARAHAFSSVALGPNGIGRRKIIAYAHQQGRTPHDERRQCRVKLHAPGSHEANDTKTSKPAAKAKDRQVTYRDGAATTQRAMIPSDGMSYNNTQTVAPDGTPMINYSAVPLGSPMRNTNFRTGTVDMAQYLSWLKAMLNKSPTGTPNASTST